MSNENLKNLDELKSTELIQDYLDLIRCSYPFCNCGKCIINRYSHIHPNYQYKKNLKSSYKNEFEWKKPENKISICDRKKPLLENLGLDKCFKEHLKNSLISVMKNDYSKNFKLKEEIIPENNINKNSQVTKNNNSLNSDEKFYSNLYSKEQKNIKEFIDNTNNGIMKNRNIPKTENYKKIANYKNNIKSINSKHSILDSNKSSLNNINIIAKNNDDKNKNYINDNSNLKNKSINNILNHNTSSNKNDFEIMNNMKYKLNDSNIIDKSLNPPFIGRSSYKLMFPDWHTEKIIKDNNRAYFQNDVTFNARTSYQDNYQEHEIRYYIDRPTPIIKLDNLESTGKLNNETTSKVAYMPIDYCKFKQLNKSEDKPGKRPSSIIPAPYSKDSFLSSYERAFMHNYIKPKSNMKNLNNSVLF